MIALLQGGALALQPFPGDRFEAETEPNTADPSLENDEEDAEPSWRDALRLALSNRTLLIWAAALVACSLLDEILVVLAVLRMTGDLALPETHALLVIAVLSGGGVLALLATESRILALATRTNPLRLLVMTCIVSVVAHVCFALSTSLAALLITGLISGAAIALQYPLAKAQLYRAIPGQTGTALAIAGLFGPIDLLLPVAIGFSADRLGLSFALLLLTAQPLALLAAAAVRIPPTRIT